MFYFIRTYRSNIYRVPVFPKKVWAQNQPTRTYAGHINILPPVVILSSDIDGKVARGASKVANPFKRALASRYQLVVRYMTFTNSKNKFLIICYFSRCCLFYPLIITYLCDFLPVNTTQNMVCWWFKNSQLKDTFIASDFAITTFGSRQFSTSGFLFELLTAE